MNLGDEKLNLARGDNKINTALVNKQNIQW